MTGGRLKVIVGDIRPSRATSAAPEEKAPLPRPFRVSLPRKVVLFSPIKPPEYMGRIARIVLAQPAEEGERFLRREMVVVSQNLVVTGADPAVVHREVRKLEAAIRAELWHIVMNAGTPR